MDCATPIEHDYDDELKSAVGTLFLTSGFVESAAGLMLAKLAAYPGKDNPRLSFAFSGMEIRLKFKKIEEFLFGLACKDLQTVRKVNSKILRQFDHRNAIAHNNSVAGKGTITPSILKITMKGIKPDTTYTAGQIINISRVMYVRLYQLNQIVERHLKVLAEVSESRAHAGQEDNRLLSSALANPRPLSDPPRSSDQ